MRVDATARIHLILPRGHGRRPKIRNERPEPMKPLSLALSAASLFAASAAAAPQVVQRIPLHDGGWDILTVDTQAHRVLISRSDGVDAIDTSTGAVTPRLISGTRFHGVTVVPRRALALATEAAGTAIVFDPVNGKVKGEVQTDPDADATIYEPATHSVWVMNGDSGTISVVDPVAIKQIAKIKVGASLEFPALDGHGHLFVNDADKSELDEIDIKSLKVVRKTPLAGCQHPTGLAYVHSGVLISACANGVAKLIRATDGEALGEVAIGPRPDGAFADEARHRAYVPSGGDGTLTIMDTSGALPRKIGTVQTQAGARTGTVDPSTGTVYLPAAKFGPPPSPGGRPALLPGSVELLVVR